MTISHPINSVNAIDAVAFIVAFSRSFTSREMENIKTLKEKLVEELPAYSEIKGVKITMNELGVQESESISSGINLSCFSESGEVKWKLEINEAQIVITCKVYDRWAKVWGKAQQYLQAVLDVLDLNNLEVNVLALQYVDRFIEKIDTYDISNVFNVETKYITTNALDAGTLWHIHQGWFEEYEHSNNLLNVLNIATNKKNNMIVTTIDHAAHAQFVNNAIVAQELFGDSKLCETIFSDLHNNNKKIITAMWNEEQQKGVMLHG